MTESEYRKIEAVRNSGLGTLIQKSPAHYLHDLRQPETTTDATRFGSYLHALVLTPDIAESDYFVLDERLRPQPDKNYQTKENALWKAATLRELTASGKQLVTLEEHQRAAECKAAIRRSGLANETMDSVGVHERLVEWCDDATGIRCKARIDKTRDKGRIVDLKSTRDASKRNFLRSIVDYGYHRQAAFYLDGSVAKEFRIIAVESQPPYGVAVYDLSPEFIEAGRAAYRFALKQIQKLRDKHGSEFDPATVWPSYEWYSPIGEIVTPPSWLSNHDFSDF